MFKNKKKAFTLAEVLLTLAVIGVVAAITIPGLIQNTKNQEYAAALGKFYAEFNGAFQKMITDKGCISDVRCTNTFTGLWPDIRNNIYPYINKAKVCDGTATGCWAPGYVKLINGSGSAYEFASGSSIYQYINFLTASGMSVAMDTGLGVGHNCDNVEGTGILTATCGDLYVDVNGLKPPNQWGRDVYAFSITNKGTLYPFGGSFFGVGGINYWNNAGAATYACNPSTGSGLGCAGRIMEDGWKIKY